MHERQSITDTYEALERQFKTRYPYAFAKRIDPRESKRKEFCTLRIVNGRAQIEHKGVWSEL